MIYLFLVYLLIGISWVIVVQAARCIEYTNDWSYGSRKREARGRELVRQTCLILLHVVLWPILMVVEVRR